MKLVYKPIGIVAGIGAGFLAKQVFDAAWALIDDEEAPEPSHRDASWQRVLTAAALQGVTYAVARAAVERGTAVAFERWSGVWPGSERAEQAD